MVSRAVRRGALSEHCVRPRRGVGRAHDDPGLERADGTGRERLEARALGGRPSSGAARVQPPGERLPDRIRRQAELDRHDRRAHRDRSDPDRGHDRWPRNGRTRSVPRAATPSHRSFSDPPRRSIVAASRRRDHDGHCRRSTGRPVRTHRVSRDQRRHRRGAHAREGVQPARRETTTTRTTTKTTTSESTQ